MNRKPIAFVWVAAGWAFTAGCVARHDAPPPPIDAGQAEVPPIVPVAWTCPSIHYASGERCDCGCGAPDPDCASSSIDACDSCGGIGSCTLAACPGPIDPSDPSRCLTATQGEGEGEGEGDDGTQPGEGEGEAVGEEGEGEEPVVPSTWTCDAFRFNDGRCDCGCGALDVDCGGAVEVEACDTCDRNGSCSQGAIGCPGLIAPSDNQACLAPHGNVFADEPQPPESPCGNAELVFDSNRLYVVGTLNPGQSFFDVVIAIDDPETFAVGFGPRGADVVTITESGFLMHIEDPADHMPNHLLRFVRDTHAFDPDEYATTYDCRYPSAPLANDVVVGACPAASERMTGVLPVATSDAYLYRCQFPTRWFESETGAELTFPEFMNPTAVFRSVVLLEHINDVGTYSLFDLDTGGLTPVETRTLFAPRASSRGLLIAELTADVNGALTVHRHIIDDDGSLSPIGSGILAPDFFIDGDLTAMNGDGSAVYFVSRVSDPAGDVILRVDDDGTTIAFDEREHIAQLHAPILFTGGKMYR